MAQVPSLITEGLEAIAAAVSVPLLGLTSHGVQVVEGGWIQHDRIAVRSALVPSLITEGPEKTDSDLTQRRTLITVRLLLSFVQAPPAT